ncbi:unnamed protein product [Acanthoscelides obtectus]|uniref:Uncharacterized protein n=1 Tax=Acanthoscelides obtectus TaxID=200917 RepID=A0A9P0JXR6_ACAOB|nr:unnamed protein product [Acanthoscelides obtectus]CAK1632016.1 hypothetical protein AOBTE_LOCUS7310 [Acanthoscelides obtectus]
MMLETSCSSCRLKLYGLHCMCPTRPTLYGYFSICVDHNGDDDHCFHVPHLADFIAQGYVIIDFFSMCLFWGGSQWHSEIYYVCFVFIF